MSLFKRGKWYWMHNVVNAVRYRLPLKTTNWQDAKRIEKEKLASIAEGKFSGQGKVARQIFSAAADAYLEERKLFKAEKTYLTECERSKALKGFFRDTPLRQITTKMIFRYQMERKKPVLKKVSNLAKSATTEKELDWFG